MHNNLTELNLSQLSNLLLRRELSSVELTNSLLGHIEQIEPELGAFARITSKKALEQAEQSDKTRNTAANPSKLNGIPYGLKDIFDTKGILTEAGSEIYKGRIPEANAHVVDLLEGNGAVLLGKTVTTEFADGHPPTTKNPWNALYTPGGSSTGSAVAVATRMLPYALGTQTVGSVLRPAAYNGIVGFKPTFGLVSRTGVIPQSQSCDTVGILCKCANDAWIVLKSIAGFDPRDEQSSVKASSFDSHDEVILNNSAPRIGFLKDYFLEESEQQVKKATLTAIESLAKNGAFVEQAIIDIDFPSGYKAHRVVQQSEMAEWHEPLFNKYAHMYKKITLEYIRSGFQHTAINYIQAIKTKTEMQHAALKTLSSFDVLITPTASGLPPSDLRRTGDTRFQSPWSFTGFPSIALPAGLSDEGLPLSIQLVGRPFQEKKLLGVAQWVESILGGLPNPIS